MVNKVILLGNLGKDPEVRHLESGSVVAKISLATTEKWKDKEGNLQEATEWHNVEVWGNSATFAENYLSSGDRVYIEGKIATDKWDDADGNQKTRTKIRAVSLYAISTKPKQQSEPKFEY